MTAGRPHWWPAYVGIGSNLDDPAAQVRRAFDQLADLPQTRLELRSSLYCSAPVGPQDQPDFVNAVAGLLTRLSADELLAALQAIEAKQGRRRDGQHWGPRTLDLDLLVYSTETRESADLGLPHPRIGERNFVLLPLAEIAPHLQIPGLGRVADSARGAAAAEPRIEIIAPPE